MLRVHWTEEEGLLHVKRTSKTGIVVGSYGQYDGMFIVRLDSGKIENVGADRIEKSEFVEI